MTALAARHVHQGTPEWLQFRLDGITATDAAIIAGETGSVVELWAQKRRLIDPPEFDEATRELMEEGLAIQPYLLDYWRRKNPGRRARAVDTMRRSKVWPIAMSSPDGEVIGEPVGIEAKMTTSPRWPAAVSAGEPVPGDVFAQVQWQMFTAGWTAVDVVVLLFGRPKLIAVARNDAYIDNLVWLARQFYEWWQSGTRPPMDGSENARRVLAKLYPRNDGTLLPAPLEVEAVALDWRAAAGAVKEAENREATLANAIRALIGDADGFEGQFGRITWKKNADSTRVNWPAVAKAYDRIIDRVNEWIGGNPEATEVDVRAMLADWRTGAIESIHTATVEGPRVLRPSWKE